MPSERLPMRKIREVLRLRFASGMSQRAIAQSLGLSQGAVCEYLNRARRAGAVWPLPDARDDERLEVLLFPPPSGTPDDQRPRPDWALVHRELRRPSVTLALLWEEYRASAPEGFGYSWFCDLYKSWTGRLKPTLRQVHVAGEKLFVDFAGQTLEVIDGLTGEVRAAQIFVATLGASSFTYAEATWSQMLPDWIEAHVTDQGSRNSRRGNRGAIPDGLVGYGVRPISTRGAARSQGRPQVGDDESSSLALDRKFRER